MCSPLASDEKPVLGKKNREGHRNDVGFQRPLKRGLPNSRRATSNRFTSLSNQLVRVGDILKLQGNAYIDHLLHQPICIKHTSYIVNFFRSKKPLSRGGKTAAGVTVQERKESRDWLSSAPPQLVDEAVIAANSIVTVSKVFLHISPASFARHDLFSSTFCLCQFVFTLS